jgi:plastocyanin
MPYRNSFGATTAAMLAAWCLLPADHALATDVVTVEIADYRYQPAELAVPAGTTVRWLNAERRTSHDVYFPKDDLGSPRLFPDESWSRQFDEPGEYPYYCRPHEDRAGMHGVIRVLAPEK